MPQARLSEEGFRRVNVGGTRNVAEGCLRHNVPALIFASTIEIYGPQTDFPIREDSPKLFTGIYSRNKWECEQMLLSYREQYGLRVSMLRMPMILGPGFYHEKAVLEMMRRVRHGRMLPLPGGPEIPFTAVAASDAAAGFLAAFDRQEVDGEAFNLAAGRGEPTRELFSRFIRRVGSTSRILPLPRWLMSPVISAAVRLNVALPVVGTPVELLPFALTGGDFDISKAERILGYRPRKDCLAALVETYEWLAGQGVL
jgi:nucleoside-diphosphate-sugar epimerase